MQRYACFLNMHRLPNALESDEREWWRWIRSTQNVEKSCQTNVDCVEIIEPGMCQNGYCVNGTGNGTACADNEDCDVIGATQNQCIKGKCQSVNPSIVYYAPAFCESDTSKPYTLCGSYTARDGVEKYVGVCTPFEFQGQTLQACRALLDHREVASIADKLRNHHKEHDMQNVFHTPPEWKRLTVCPAEQQKFSDDGRSICMAATRTLPLNGSLIWANNEEDARDLCDDKTNTVLIDA